MEIVHSQIAGYLHSMAPSADPVLLEMEQIAEARKFPIVGRLIGRILEQQARLLQARRVIELGSGFGYSAYWFSRALEGDAELHLTDFSSDDLGRARQYLERSGSRCRCYCHQGEGLEILDSLEGDFDIIFNDVDKAGYPDVYRRALPRLRTGGLLISDNVLWRGTVTQPGGDRDTQAVKEYNRLIFQDDRLLSVIFPLRDGLAVSLKR